MLSLTTDLEGSSEVGGLFLHPEARAGGLGALLARSRYLFMKLHRQRFGERTLAELRGVIDEAGNSPFWDALAGRFFDMSFPEADEFNAVHGTRFIADLMPRTPIYVALLRRKRQGGDGRAAPDRPAGASDARGGRLPASTATSTFSTAGRRSPPPPTTSARSANRTPSRSARSAPAASSRMILAAGRLDRFQVVLRVRPQAAQQGAVHRQGSCRPCSRSSEGDEVLAVAR